MLLLRHVGCDEVIFGTSTHLPIAGPVNAVGWDCCNLHQSSLLLGIEVSGKITETQLDHQRRFITERLESARAKLDDYRAQEASGAEKRRLMEAVLAWAREVGQGLDELTPEQRREILQMIVEQIVIDRDNNVDITLAIPIDEDSPGSDSVAIASESSSCGT